MFGAKFPTIDFNAVLATLTDEEKAMLPYIFHKKDGTFRKSKVKFAYAKQTKETYTIDYGDGLSSTFQVWRFPTPEDKLKAESAYVWRMIGFYCVNTHPYNCMPVTASFDIEGTPEEQKATKERLELLVDKLLTVIGHENWHTANRWAKALGVG